MTLRKGTVVATSGLGRTAAWKRQTGTVTRKRGIWVYVRWDAARFTEDEMALDEVTTDLTYR